MGETPHFDILSFPSIATVSSDSPFGETYIVHLARAGAPDLSRLVAVADDVGPHGRDSM